MSNANFKRINRVIHTFSSAADFMFLFSRLFSNEDIRVAKSVALTVVVPVVHICMHARIVKCPGF